MLLVHIDVVHLHVHGTTSTSTSASCASAATSPTSPTTTVATVDAAGRRSTLRVIAITLSFISVFFNTFHYISHTFLRASSLCRDAPQLRLGRRQVAGAAREIVSAEAPQQRRQQQSERLGRHDAPRRVRCEAVAQHRGHRGAQQSAQAAAEVQDGQRQGQQQRGKQEEGLAIHNIPLTFPT